MPFYVSRQNYGSLGENANVVEIAGGGRDYANPGQLVSKFTGEAEEYDNPVTAVNAAISILKEWEAIGGKKLTIRHGHTGGNTIPFDAPEHGQGIKEAQQWAAKTWANLPKCARCGDVLPPEGKRFKLSEYDYDEEYCSENCANMAGEFCAAEDRKFQETEWTATIEQMERTEVVELLNGVGIECYDSESTITLKTALLENVKDGTLKPSALNDWC